MLESISEVEMGLVVKGLVCEEEENVKLDALCVSESVEVPYDRGDVITGIGKDEEAGSRVLNVLKFPEDHG